MMHFYVTLVRSLLTGVGAVWLFLEPYYTLKDVAPSDRLGIWWFVLLSIVAGLVWFVVDGFFISGFLKTSIIITSNAFDSRVSIKFGDVFQESGWKAISVNEFFDSAVDDRHVSAMSLHGIMLTKFWPGHTNDFDRQIASALQGIEPRKEVPSRVAPGKTRAYKVGTTATATQNGNNFLCVVLTRTDTETLQASATSDFLHVALRELLKKARTVCSGQPLNIPLLGSGLARTGIKPNIIVDLILLAIFEESKRQKITNEIRIVLPEQMRDQIDLITLRKDWG